MTIRKFTTRSFSKTLLPALEALAREYQKEKGILPNDKNTLEMAVLEALEKRGIHFEPEAEQ